jgi:acetylornithine deacetylase/succinyl-diaminopimelate desuccinylase-like protein
MVEAVLSSITEARLLELQLALAAIPAPPFGEAERAARVAALWREAGLHPSFDATGNVIAARPGSAERPLLALSAHLDTVFPFAQDLRILRAGETCAQCRQRIPEPDLHGPGIADCAAGLAAVTALAEALQAAAAATASPLLFVATVGEEGPGNLRGARALFSGEWSDRIGAFVTVDLGVPGALVHEGIASRRFRATFSGPGGHAWDDFGTYSPIHAAADAIARVSAIRLPRGGSTFNVGVVHGGRAVNAIPESAYFELDLRSVDPETLEGLAGQAQAAVRLAHEAQSARTHGPGSFRIDPIGDRPGGRIPREAPLVQAAVRALAAEGIRARFGPASLDANIPLARGIPAIGFPWGGHSRRAHSVCESFSPKGRVEAVRALARLVLDYR